MSTPPAHPPIVTPEVWRAQRLKLLEEEKALTRQADKVSAQRRRLPMVRLEKPYVFEGKDGKARLLDLFKGQQQLIVYHFMYDPNKEKACPGCTGFVNAMGDLTRLEERRSRFVLISRAQYPKLEAYGKAQGWEIPWYSSFGSDFNYDFHVTQDAAVAPVEYNYRVDTGPSPYKGESHGLSVFFRVGEEVFHTYSAYARGVESATDLYSLLDKTPYGRQEDWEDSPEGWPQRPTYG